MDSPEPITYRDAGVDIEAKTNALGRMKSLIESTHNDSVLGGIGSFGGLFRAPGEGFVDPVLVSSTDGVGTKLKVGTRLKRYNTLGVDLVNHCVNDILVQGARPLFFMDYIALGPVEDGVLESLVEGFAVACKDHEIALLGGETAELPGLYAEGDFDLAGFIVGVVDRPKLIDGSRIRTGDQLLGLASSGLHTNGYTLAQKVLFEKSGLDPNAPNPDLGKSVAEELLTPHRSYWKTLEPILEDSDLHGLAHITGGGFADNIERILPQRVDAMIRYGAWSVPKVFELIRQHGPVEIAECLRTFNMGVGMVAVVSESESDRFQAKLAQTGIDIWHIGEVVAGSGTVRIEGI